MKPFSNALLFAAVMIFTVSCVSDNDPGRAEPSDRAGNVDIVLNLRTPGEFKKPATRSLSYADENTIDDVYVLVFDNGSPSKLTSVHRADDVTDKTSGSGAMTSPAGAYSGGGAFSVGLPASSDGATANLMVLANAENILDARDVIDKTAPTTPSSMIGQSYETVVAAIFDAITGVMYPGSTGETIPMWGETGPITVDLSAKPDVTLMRAVARIDVGLGDGPNYDTSKDPAYTWDGKDADGVAIPFSLTSIHVVSANKEYLVVPATANRSGTSVTKPSIPTIPSKFPATTDAEARALEYTVSNDLYTTQSIYVPEADILMMGMPSSIQHKNRMALVVGGKYDGSNETTYYRLDFANDGDLMNVLRNHLYRFNISSVTGKGYSTVLEAYESDAMNNMTAEVVDLDESEVDYVMVDGSYYLGVSQRVVFLDAMGETVIVTIKTNVPDFTMNVGGGDAEIVGGTKKKYTSNGIEYTLSDPVDETYTLTITAPRSGSLTTSRQHAWTIAAKRIEMPFNVTQGALSLAAPGVIGYIKGTNTLTLKGSKEYASNPGIKAFADETFGGLENETVYVAFFQFGSLVAISSDGSDSVMPSLEPDDILAVPSEWMSLADAQSAIGGDWDSIPVSEPSDWSSGGRSVSDPSYHNPEIAKGDPCMYYFGDKHNGGWRMPVGGATDDITSAGSWNAGTFGAAPTHTPNVGVFGAHATMFRADDAGLGIPAGMRAGDDTAFHPADWTMFLPAVGRRDPWGIVCNQGTEGVYWTSTRYKDIGSLGYRLQFYGNVVRPSDNAEYHNALPVRCVQPEPTRGIRAVEGVIGYYANGDRKGELTLDGDDGDEEDIVEVAYFKFGSLVATDSSNEYDGFTADDIVAAPTEYKDIDDLKNHVSGLGSVEAAWASIPGITSAHNLTRGDEISKFANNAQGIGDPCAYYFGSGWTTPTAVENVKFVGGPDIGTADETFWQRWTPGQNNYWYYDTEYGGTPDYVYGYYDYWNSNGATHAGTVSDPNTGSFPVYPNTFYGAFDQSLPAAGWRHSNGFVNYQGTSGYYWSSTALNNTEGYYLRFYGASVDPVFHDSSDHGFAVRCKQPEPTEYPGIRAVEGVIGYYADGPKKGELTLDGDDGDNVDKVYVAYFKFGSLVATDSSNEGDGFTADDIIASPAQYRSLDDLKAHVSTFDKNAPAWAEIPGIDASFGLQAGDDIYKVADPSKGLGDPCAYWFGNGWRLPTVFENVQFVGGPKGGTWETWRPGLWNGYNNGPANSGIEWSYFDHNGAHNGSVIDPHVACFPIAANSEYQAFSQELPAAGARNTTLGLVQSQGGGGNYLSSSIDSTPGFSGFYGLSFNKDRVYSPANYDPFGGGLAARCIQNEQLPEPTLVPGVRAVRGTIGYYANGAKKGQLTLDGDDGDLTDIVNVAYFKYGSLIATDCTEEEDGFNYKDIVAAPAQTDGYRGLEDLKTHIATISNPKTAWEALPVSPPLAAETNLVSDPASWAKGLGDPCAYYFDHLNKYGKGGWRLPTNQENINYVGQADDSSNGSPYYTWVANGLSVENPGMGTFPMGTAGGKSLPAAGGRMAHSTLGGRGTSGHYMSSTARDNSFVYSLNFADTRAKPSDFNSVYGFGFTVRCVQDVLNGGENHVLYFDSSDASHPLKVGRWAATRAGDGNVKRGNGTEPMKAVTKVGDMAFFKFGSVVGFTGGSEIEPFSSARIKFDPSTNQGVYAGSDGEQLYGNIPVYTYNTEKMNVSDRATYHTGANLHAGKGDPCRLAGFDISTLTGSAADAALLAAYDSGWRLPTVEENRIFVGLEPTDFNQVQHGSPQYDTQIGGGSWTSNYSLPLNNPGIATFPANIHAPGIALPAAGLCDRNYGTINRPGNRGDYWSSTALTSEAGFTLYLSEEYASPSLENGYADGRNVRCVRNI